MNGIAKTNGPPPRHKRGPQSQAETEVAGFGGATGGRRSGGRSATRRGSSLRRTWVHRRTAPDRQRRGTLEKAENSVNGIPDVNDNAIAFELRSGVRDVGDGDGRDPPSRHPDCSPAIVDQIETAILGIQPFTTTAPRLWSWTATLWRMHRRTFYAEEARPRFPEPRHRLLYERSRPVAGTDQLPRVLRQAPDQILIGSSRPTSPTLPPVSEFPTGHATFG